MSSTKAVYDIAGLIKYADRSPWAEAMDETLSAHLGPVLDEAGLDPESLFARIGTHWEGNLWGCAFEDLLTQEIGPGHLNLVEDYLKRRGWNEKAPNKAYMRALRHSVMSLYEVSEVVPGHSMKLRDLLREAEPVTVLERSATQTLVNWDRIAARVVAIHARHDISGALLSFGPEASAELIAAIAHLSAFPDADAGFDVTDRDQLLRHSAPLFTAMWLRDCLGALSKSGLPEIVNADGEDVVIYRIVFPIVKGAVQKDIAQRLDTVANLESAGTKFWNWLARSAGIKRKAHYPGRRPAYFQHHGRRYARVRHDCSRRAVCGSRGKQHRARREGAGADVAMAGRPRGYTAYRNSYVGADAGRRNRTCS
jgi:hypothetical protein